MPAQIPLVLQSEFNPADAGTLAPEALLASARDSGLASAPFEPRCMAHRRISEPGILRQVYFVRFEWAALTTFRQRIAGQMRAAGGRGLDPAALPPLLIVAASDAAFGRWLPLRPEGDDDCLAPIAVK